MAGDSPFRRLRRLLALVAAPTGREAAGLAYRGIKAAFSGKFSGKFSENPAEPDAADRSLERGLAAGIPRASLEAQWEKRDMGHVWVLFAGGALYFGLAVVLAVLWSLQSVLGRPPGPAGFRASALPHAGDSSTIMRFRSRAPGLFPDPPYDLARYREAMALKAPDYGWVDREAGLISMPVAQAMDRIAASGWPHWSFPDVQGGAAAQPASPARTPDTTQGGAP